MPDITGFMTDWTTRWQKLFTNGFLRCDRPYFFGPITHSSTLLSNSLFSTTFLNYFLIVISLMPHQRYRLSRLSNIHHAPCLQKNSSVIFNCLFIFFDNSGQKTPGHGQSKCVKNNIRSIPASLNSTALNIPVLLSLFFRTVLG